MHARKAARWYAAVLLLESVHPEKPGTRKLFELQVRLVRARSDQAAWDHANDIAKAQEQLVYQRPWQQRRVGPA